MFDARGYLFDWDNLRGNRTLGIAAPVYWNFVLYWIWGSHQKGKALVYRCIALFTAFIFDCGI